MKGEEEEKEEEEEEEEENLGAFQKRKCDFEVTDVHEQTDREGVRVKKRKSNYFFLMRCQGCSPCVEDAVGDDGDAAMLEVEDRAPL